LREALSEPRRQPASLRMLLQEWRADGRRMYAAPPSLALSVIGQGVADEVINPESESRLVGALLTHWALRSTLDRSAICATTRPQPMRSPRTLARAS